MKYFVKFFVITFLTFVCTNAFGETSKVLFIDLKIVLNESKAGKKAQNYLKKTVTKNEEKFQKIEESLKDKEAELIGKKDILSKEEYKKMADNLRIDVQNYQKDRNEMQQKIFNQRSEARSKLVETLKPILEEYSKENNVSIIINKKDVLYADPSLDITRKVIEIIDVKLPSINLN